MSTIPDTNLRQKRQKIRLRIPELPNAMHSYDDWLTLRNQDLPELDNVSLFQEKLRVEIALANLDLQREPLLYLGPYNFMPASQWLLRRLIAIKRELKQRTREGKQR